MKARFNLSASVTPPGTYGSEGSATHHGDLHFEGDKGDPWTREKAQLALTALDARYATLRLEIEASLLAYAAEKEKEAADLAAKVAADQAALVAAYPATYAAPEPEADVEDDLPI